MWLSWVSVGLLIAGVVDIEFTWCYAWSQGLYPNPRAASANMGSGVGRQRVFIGRDLWIGLAADERVFSGGFLGATQAKRARWR